MVSRKTTTQNYTKKLFKQFIESNISLRQLARDNNIPFTTLRDRFKVMFGRDYMKRKAGEGTIHKIIKDSLKNVPPRYKDEVLAWYTQNKEFLLAESHKDNLNSKKYISDDKVNRDTKFHCFLPFDVAESPYL